MTTAVDFVRQQLNSAGWAPLHQKAAALICADVTDHLSFTAWMHSPGVAAKLFRCPVYLANVSELGEVLVVSRSSQFLAERMGWLGLPATAVRVLGSTGKPSATDVVRKEVSPVGDRMDRVKQLRDLAGQNPPSHDCDLRREILAAREEVAQMDAAEV